MSDCPGPRHSLSGSVWIWPVLPSGLSGTLGGERAPPPPPCPRCSLYSAPGWPYHAYTLDGLNSRNSHSSGGQKSEIQVLAGLFLGGSWGTIHSRSPSASGIPWLQAPPLSSITFSSMSVSTFPLLMRTPVIEFRGHSTPA